jgi:uncharacterized protein (TIGR02284 family)
MADDTVSQLNHLVEVCRNGENGFRRAAIASQDAHLRSVLAEYASQREQFATQLRYQVSRLGGRPENEGTIAGAVHRKWMDLRSAVSSYAERALIRECERGERFALASYKLALENGLDPQVAQLVEAQRAQIELAYRDLQQLQKQVCQRGGMVKQLHPPL